MINVAFFKNALLKRISALLFALFMLKTSQAAIDLESQITQASGGVSVVSVSTPTELQAFRTQLKPVLQGQNTANWQALAIEQVNQTGFISLQETASAKCGRGFFTLNPQAKNNWLLQAPHSDSDLYTGKITSRLFLTGAFKAAQWNTVKRDISDLAHAPDTYWLAFTQAFAEQYPDGKIIQLHGFEQTNHITTVATSTDVIVSAGHRSPPDWVKQTAACLKKNLPQRVSLFPNDVQELGGTTNVQGQLLRSLGHNGFIHIEMSKETRQALLNDADLRNQFMSCF